MSNANSGFIALKTRLSHGGAKGNYPLDYLKKSVCFRERAVEAVKNV